MKASYVVWGIWIAVTLGSFAVLEILGYLRSVPWITLSETVWSAENIAQVIRWVLFAGLSILTIHLVARWP